MKKKLIPAVLFLLFTPSCIFVVSERDECEHCHDRYEAEHDHDHEDQGE